MTEDREYWEHHFKASPGTKDTKSFYANIWIGGNYDDAVRACREYCQDNALCVAVTRTAFVYVGGMEDGVCVRLMQYPRFPEDESELRKRAIDLAWYLRPKLSQRSFSIEFPDTTYYDTLAVAR